MAHPILDITSALIEYIIFKPLVSELGILWDVDGVIVPLERPIAL